MSKTTPDPGKTAATPDTASVGPGTGASSTDELPAVPPADPGEAALDESEPLHATEATGGDDEGAVAEEDECKRQHERGEDLHLFIHSTIYIFLCDSC